MKLQGQEMDVVRKGSGQPLLLLHGGGGPIAAMPFADKLAEKFEIIAPTHPGFGGSKIPDHFNRVDDLVFLYLDLLDELDLNDVILMGFSMGGWTAVELATMNSTRLSKMILVDPVGVKVGGREDRDIADVFALPGEKLVELPTGSHSESILGIPTCTIRSCRTGCTGSKCRPISSGAKATESSPSITARNTAG
jgi:pimeloyl-ACP methyl ester carboxylesterase